MADKFLPPLIDFIQEKFSHEGNVFYLYGDESVYGFLKDRGVFFLGKKVNGMLLGKHSETLLNIKKCLPMLELAMNYHLICLMHMIIMSRKIVKGYFL